MLLSHVNADALAYAVERRNVAYPDRAAEDKKLLTYTSPPAAGELILRQRKG